MLRLFQLSEREAIFLIFYADVYFLINFTVDTLALYFASLLGKIPTSVKRILILALLGAALALVSLLIFGGFLGELILSAVFFLATGLFISKEIKAYRRIKFTVIFAVFEFLIGGMVSFGYDFLDRHFYSVFEKSEINAPNRRLLILSIMILLAIGVFKLMVLFFSHTAAERSVGVEISLLGKTLRTEALVDTGNLLRSASGGAVILIKKDFAQKLHNDFPIGIDDVSKLGGEFLTRISLLPVSSVSGQGILVGIKSDRVKIILKDGTYFSVPRAVLALDKEGGTYDGFEVLMPAAALDDLK